MLGLGSSASSQAHCRRSRWNPVLPAPGQGALGAWPQGFFWRRPSCFVAGSIDSGARPPVATPRRLGRRAPPTRRGQRRPLPRRLRAPGRRRAPARPIARVTAGNGTLPNEHGQVWREYDISPYTARVTTTKRPEQAIVDWILRETGYEAWHCEPLGILSATPRTLRVYHTPQMQAVVADVVDRFVASEAERPDLQPPRDDDRQPELARAGAERCCAPSRCRPPASGLAACSRKSGGAAGRVAAPQRLPRAQFAAPAGQQRAIDRSSPCCGRGLTSAT